MLATPLPGAAATGEGGGSADRGPLLVLGDSLSAEYGIARGSGWVGRLEARLRVELGAAAPAVVNASISGDTTSGGLSRLPELLKRHRPQLTVIELGANDALRGLPMTATRDNLKKLIGLARDAGSKPVLIGMMMPPNFGPAYTKRFEQMFHDVARDEQLSAPPFLLDGFAEDLSMFQEDRIHPLAKAQPRMLDNVWPSIRSALAVPKGKVRD